MLADLLSGCTGAVHCATGRRAHTALAPSSLPVVICVEQRLRAQLQHTYVCSHHMAYAAQRQLQQQARDGAQRVGYVQEAGHAACAQPGRTCMPSMVCSL